MTRVYFERGKFSVVLINELHLASNIKFAPQLRISFRRTRHINRHPFAVNSVHGQQTNEEQLW